LRAAGIPTSTDCSKAERDVKRVHEDVRTLMQVGLIARTEEGAFHVPYEVIHADFDLRAVA
jgi:predicted transcriptional regulator